jgi:hypothetical protein
MYYIADFLRLHENLVEYGRLRPVAVCLLVMTLMRRNHVAKPLGIKAGELARRL